MEPTRRANGHRRHPASVRFGDDQSLLESLFTSNHLGTACRLARNVAFFGDQRGRSGCLQPSAGRVPDFGCGRYNRCPCSDIDWLVSGCGSQLCYCCRSGFELLGSGRSDPQELGNDDSAGAGLSRSAVDRRMALVALAALHHGKFGCLFLHPCGLCTG